MLEHPARREQRTRQALLRDLLQRLVCVVTPAAETPTAPNVDAHVHVAFAGGERADEIEPISGILSRDDQIARLPPVVQEDAVAVVEIDAVFGVELVLVVESAVGVDGVVPNHLALRRKCLEFEAELFEELLERADEGSRNGAGLDVHEIAVEVGLFAERGEPVREEGIEPTVKRGGRVNLGLWGEGSGPVSS